MKNPSIEKHIEYDRLTRFYNIIKKYEDGRMSSSSYNDSIYKQCIKTLEYLGIEKDTLIKFIEEKNTIIWKILV